MSREILFRGKTLKGEWVEGYYYINRYRYAGGEDFIAENPTITTGITEASGAYSERLEEIEYEIIPETVGQYTGLRDRKRTKEYPEGQMIFEGDILKIARVSDSIGSFYFSPLNYPVNVVVRWDMCAWMWETLCKDKRYIHFPDAWCHYECEVIGNMHDNPELLKGE